MKQYITKFLKSVAIVSAAFPVWYPVLAALFFDIPMEKAIWIVFSPLFFIVSATVLLTGYGFWEMKRWSWYVFIASQVLLAFESITVVQDFSESHNKLFALIVTLLVQLGVIYRVSKDLRVPYFFPKIRWWESNPRYRLSAPVVLQRKSGDQFEGSILDLTAGGCFIKVRSDILEGEALTVNFNMYNQEIRCDGVAVWKTESTVTCPKGVGIKFSALSKSQKRSLRIVHRRLKKISFIYRKFRYILNQEEFLKKIEEVELGSAENDRHVDG